MKQNSLNISVQMHHFIVAISILSIAVSFTGSPRTFLTGPPGIAGVSVPAIPVLCYHNITEKRFTPGVLWIDRQQLDGQLKMLHDSGYKSILPSELHDHVTRGTRLPAKPVIITFDDSHDTHYSIARPLLEKYGFRGVFFVMTVTLGKTNYLSPAQLKDLAKHGHVIGCHTYDHKFVTKLEMRGWQQQVWVPGRELALLTGSPVEYFAYPYGAWNAAAVDRLKQYGYKAAFQLAGKTSETDPLFTIRRMMVDGNWTGATLQKQMCRSFRKAGNEVQAP